MKSKNMSKKRCNHANLGHVEVIEAYHQAMIDYQGNLITNNEAGGLLRNQVDCMDCGKRWIVTKSSPKFIVKYHLEIQRLRDER